MKMNKRALQNQRRRLDATIEKFTYLKDTKAPRTGWLKSVREALGLSAQQLAKRMGIKSVANVFNFEEREQNGTVTLQALQKAAEAMDCKLVYAIVPNSESFDSLLEKRAYQAAKEILAKVSHTMRLEDQQTSNQEVQHQTKQLAQDLKEKLDSRLWS